MYFWVTSCSPSWREFNLEFRTPANNIVSLYTDKISDDVNGGKKLGDRISKNWEKIRGKSFQKLG